MPTLTIENALDGDLAQISEQLMAAGNMGLALSAATGKWCGNSDYLDHHHNRYRISRGYQ
jgi:hypothetical protein